MTILVSIVVIFVIIAVLDYAEKIKRLWGCKIKGPPFLPIIGNAHNLVFIKPAEFFQRIGEMTPKYEALSPINRVWIFNKLIVGISKPEYIEPVLNSSSLITKSDEYSFISNWLGNGVLIATGKKWQTRRKIITPALHYSHFDNFIKIFDKHSKIFVQKLDQINPITSVDVSQVVNLFALDVICESTMGRSLDVQLKKNSEYVKAVQEMLNIIHKRTYNGFLRPEFLFRLSSSGARERKCIKTLNKWSVGLIEKRREELLNSDSAGISHGNNEIGQKGKTMLLDILLQASIDGKPLTNEEIREEVSTFMFAGHDTSASGLSFLLYNIALYPAVQEKILEEIQSVIGMDYNKELSIGDLKNLTYLECVIKESLRLFPSVPFIGRYFDEDTQLKDIRIPAKTTVTIKIFHVARNPELFPEPEVFKPERFLEDGIDTTRNPYSYIPFSAGPRNCMGKKFALFEMKTIVVRILQKFRITVDPSYDKPILVAAVVLRSENGILLNFQKRN